LQKEITPFDFINAASFSKDDLINNHQVPEQAEKLYTAYIVNRGFANFEDTILHANEMNQRPHLFNGAQFDYYRGALRKRKRFSKWLKSDVDKDLDALQEVYQCNRTVAKMHQKALSPDQMVEVHAKLQTGG